jgi:STE24 endopeptidase
MSPFALLFLVALALSTAIRLWLGWRQIQHVSAHRMHVPPQFAGEISLVEHQKAADYTIEKTRFALIGVMVEAVIVLAFTFGGGLQWLHDISSALLPEGIARGVVLIALVALLLTLLDVPFDLYRTFVIEERFGFNKMTLGLFFVDLLKSLLIGAVLFLPLVGVILWLIDALGPSWWIYAWMVTVIFGVFVTFIAPTVIMPLFNKFSPLQDAEIRERVQKLAERCGFRVKGLLVMDGSRRSAHGNAFFSGFGSSKRIVFFDTLLSQLRPPEIEAVLAHELGHFKLKHVIKRMAWSFSLSLAFFWLLSFLMYREWFFESLGVVTASPAMALILFALILPPFTFLLKPIASMYSRKHEFEADEYAARYASAVDLASALIKLYKDNASTLTPDPLHSAFYDSHPPALTRIARLQGA